MLVYKHNKYFLHIPVTFDVKDCEFTSVAHIVGIDRGINFLATTYDSAGKTTDDCVNHCRGKCCVA